MEQDKEENEEMDKKKGLKARGSVEKGPENGRREDRGIIKQGKRKL